MSDQIDQIDRIATLLRTLRRADPTAVDAESADHTNVRSSAETRGAARQAASLWLKQARAGSGAWVEQLAQHQLAGYCFGLVRAAGLDGELSPAAAERLGNAYGRQVRRNERLLGLLLDLDARLGEAGVPYLLMKGFLQSVRFAGGLHRRLMWDLDILIRPQDLGATMAAAESLGLRARAGSGLDPRPLLRRLHAIELLDERRNLDIHWVFRNRQGMRRTYAETIATAQPLELGAVRVHGIGDLDTLTMACLGLGNDIERSHVRLRKVWDVYLIAEGIDAWADWEGWLERLAREGSLKTVLNVLSFCLLAVAAADDCPRLRARLERHADALLIHDAAMIPRIMRRPRQSLGNRMLMSRLQPVSVARYWVWWLGTLPVRYWHGRNV